MSRGMIYKLFFIVFLIVFSSLLILPTVGTKKMEIKFSATSTAEDIEFVKKRFSTGGYELSLSEQSLIVSGRNITDAIMNEVRIYKGVADAKLLKHWVETTFLAKKINLGLDLQGGMHLVLQANFEGIQKKIGRELTEKDKNEIAQQALELLRNRIDKFGVSEPSIRPRGNEAIEIQLPGVKDPSGVKKAIGTTGSLEYRLVDDKYTAMAASWMGQNYKEKNLPENYDELKLVIDEISKGISLPENLETLFFYKRDKDTGAIIPDYPIVLEKQVSLLGTDIQEATVDRDEYGQVVVVFKTTADGAVKFAEATSEKNHGRKLAIILDNKVRNAPNIKETIGSGSGNISGGFTYEEALTLARIIKEGALPVDLKIIEERTVGPTLGQDSIEAGIKAFALGIVIIMIFMIAYYKVAGLIADIGLILNMIFMLATLSLLGFTLTLPGIAGFLLTMGMAVDANVIIYERIKEEIKKGKSVRMAIVAGFDRAFWTIFDSNLTTLLAAFILFQFGTGPIKGFAVTLFIGILASMFVALYVTRFTYEIISLNKKIKKLHI
ncbi:MAG TPA: protein translocase subunit SecD [Spirochaetota bacterium]|nr:protein translocase subunit SecD [Spirochaetota bacterium]HPF04706.1 protein translocase subunit SecD [Spirochaetota bacterium]HPJ41931.1 protein translocase subunit SecD [Spirochaetota bacterium]HPR38047.1 protein translocase subunit SecD [Spirochaetota bacterium]HRX48364.1 protein translocase subunit SecD [Spirochaetota bacterium]